MKENHIRFVIVDNEIKTAIRMSDANYDELLDFIDRIAERWAKIGKVAYICEPTARHRGYRRLNRVYAEDGVVKWNYSSTFFRGSVITNRSCYPTH